MQSLLDVLPVLAVDVPAGQFEQVPAPADEYVPNPHWPAHEAVAAVPYVPASQGPEH